MWDSGIRYNLHWELPATGGGNLPFRTLTEAKREAQAMHDNYPDIFISITRLS